MSFGEFYQDEYQLVSSVIIFNLRDVTTLAKAQVAILGKG